MDYDATLKSLNEATLFDLYRLHVAIGNELDNPKRLTRIKQALRQGMETSFFCDERNCLIAIRVIELKSTKVIAQEIEAPNKRYRLPYFMLNVANVDAHLNETDKKLDINNLSVGDIVGFTKDGKDIIGVIKRLNQKTVTLKTNSGEQQWRVAYSYLYRVHDVDNTIMEMLSRDHH